MFDEPELHIISFAEVDDDRRAERDRQRAESRRLYVNDLAVVLTELEAPASEIVRWAEAIVDHLFVTPRRDSDGACLCGCHPRLPATDFHGYGFACSCRLSADERSAAWRATMAEMDAFWDSAEGRARKAGRQVEEDELVAWLVGHPDVVVTSHGGWAPEQWRGSVEGHSFYFRERHDQWRIELDLVPAGRFSRVWRGGDLDDESSFEMKELDQGEVIAEGAAGGAGYGRTPTERVVFITEIVRDHLRIRHCPVHTTERDTWEARFGRPLAWCPACGAKLRAA
ncbi:MAG: hypothetical protein ACR2MN_09705 [Acidimicrobiales bacterium]